MKILVIQHEESTTPGSTLKYLDSRNIDYDLHFFKYGCPPSAHYDGIIILGGGMNVDESAIYPWLIDEKNYIKFAIEENKLIFGICLGAQLLSELLGGEVFCAEEWELGWHPVQLNNHDDPLIALHWHGQQFTLPAKAKNLGSTPACKHQGFQVGNIKAYQFHPEADEGWVVPNAKNAKFPEASRFVQSREEVVLGLKYQSQLENWYFNELDSFFKI